MLNDEAPYRYEIPPADSSERCLFYRGYPLSSAVSIQRSQLALDGHVSLLPLAVNFKVELQDLDAVAFKPYFAGCSAGKLGGLKVNLESTVSGTPDEIVTQRQPVLYRSLTFFSMQCLMRRWKMPNWALVRCVVRSDSRDVASPPIRLAYNAIKVNTTGKVSGLLSALALDLALLRSRNCKSDKCNRCSSCVAR